MAVDRKENDLGKKTSPGRSPEAVARRVVHAVFGNGGVGIQKTVTGGKVNVVALLMPDIEIKLRHPKTELLSASVDECTITAMTENWDDWLSCNVDGSKLVLDENGCAIIDGRKDNEVNFRLNLKDGFKEILNTVISQKG